MNDDWRTHRMEPAFIDSTPCRCGSEMRRGTAVFVLLALLAGGCSHQEQIREDYGMRSGPAGSSVNGLGVLADMFDDAGCDVFSWRRLSPQLNDYHVIVWAPDDFQAPTPEQREFLDKWLQSDTGRSLVYIGRDFDAVVRYWDIVVPSTSAEQKPEITRRLAQAQSRHDRARVLMPANAVTDWFVVRRDYPLRRVNELSGPWSENIDAARADIWVHGRLDVPTAAEIKKLSEAESPSRLGAARFETLLETGQVQLVYRVVRPDWGTNQVIVVVNGSFLLNLPLVNVEHRKLADRLIRECRARGKVAIIESGAGGPLVQTKESQSRDPEATRRRVLLAVHWVILGMLFCLSVFPLFGRPRPGPPEAVAEFGQHIDALGALLEKTGDQDYAQHQLEQYQSRGET